MVVTGDEGMNRRSPPPSPKSADATSPPPSPKRPMPALSEDDIVKRAAADQAKTSVEEDRLNHLKGY